jgi:hypothetical protein
MGFLKQGDDDEECQLRRPEHARRDEGQGPSSVLEVEPARFIC